MDTKGVMIGVRSETEQDGVLQPFSENTTGETKNRSLTPNWLC